MRCNGEGKVKEEMIEWHENGKILANKRRDYGLKMRDAAKYLKIEVTNLSKMERGIIEPNMSINYNKMRVIKQ
jgi:transcriptional regulator with XRE-family HTH domain